MCKKSCCTGMYWPHKHSETSESITLGYIIIQYLIVITIILTKQFLWTLSPNSELIKWRKMRMGLIWGITRIWQASKTNCDWFLTDSVQMILPLTKQWTVKWKMIWGEFGNKTAKWLWWSTPKRTTRRNKANLASLNPYSNVTLHNVQVLQAYLSAALL